MTPGFKANSCWANASYLSVQAPMNSSTSTWLGNSRASKPRVLLHDVSVR